VAILSNVPVTSTCDPGGMPLEADLPQLKSARVHKNAGAARQPPVLARALHTQQPPSSDTGLTWTSPVVRTLEMAGTFAEPDGYPCPQGKGLSAPSLPSKRCTAAKPSAAYSWFSNARERPTPALGLLVVGERLEVAVALSEDSSSPAESSASTGRPDVMVMRFCRELRYC